MTSVSAKFLGFWTPSPFVTHSRNLSVVFVTYWATPPPPSVRTSYKYRPKDIGDRAKELSQMVKEKVEGERTRGGDGPAAAATRVWRNPYRVVVQHDITREWNS